MVQTERSPNFRFLKDPQNFYKKEKLGQVSKGAFLTSAECARVSVRMRACVCLFNNGACLSHRETVCVRLGEGERRTLLRKKTFGKPN